MVETNAIPELAELKAARSETIKAAREANDALVKYAFERIAEACSAFAAARESINAADFYSAHDYADAAGMLADIREELCRACRNSSDDQ